MRNEYTTDEYLEILNCAKLSPRSIQILHENTLNDAIIHEYMMQLRLILNRGIPSVLVLEGKYIYETKFNDHERNLIKNIENQIKKRYLSILNQHIKQHKH